MINDMPISSGSLIRLAAVDLTQNISRSYEIYVARDLFGEMIVEYHWGRTGTKGQGRRRCFPSMEVAEPFVRSLLKRRASAKKRIGVEYTRLGNS